MTFRHKKRLSIPDIFFINLKSNTMKNTVQRYVLAGDIQILAGNQRIL